MDYTITEVKGTYPSNYPDSKKYVFRLEGYANDVSAFSKFEMKVGDVIHGNIEVKGIYHNFKFAKKGEASRGGTVKLDETQWLILNRKLEDIWTAIQVLKGQGLNSDGSKVPDFGEDDLPSF